MQPREARLGRALELAGMYRPSVGLLVMTTSNSSTSCQSLAVAASLNVFSILGHLLPVLPLELDGLTTNTQPLRDVAIVGAGPKSPAGSEIVCSASFAVAPFTCVFVMKPDSTICSRENAGVALQTPRLT